MKMKTENEPLFSDEFRAYQDLSFCKIFGCPDKAEKVLFDENGNAQKKSDGKYKTQKIDVALKNDKNEGQENIGNIIFFDAYPTHSPQGCIKADIMNNHYQPYYNGEVPPADYHKLNPIIFLTVEGSEFSIYGRFAEKDRQYRHRIRCEKWRYAFSSFRLFKTRPNPARHRCENRSRLWLYAVTISMLTSSNLFC